MNRRETSSRPVSARLKRSLGSNRFVVWAIKHIVSPIDRLTVKIGRGRIPPPTSLAVPTLLLTTVGRKSGRARTIPLVFVPDRDAFVVGNARPVGERRNPWVLNLRASGSGTVRHDGRTVDVIAHELGADELDRWWPELTAVWPAFETHYAGTGERSVFRLEPVESHQKVPPVGETTAARGGARSHIRKPTPSCAASGTSSFVPGNHSSPATKLDSFVNIMLAKRN